MKTGWNYHELYMWHEPGNAAGTLPAGLAVQPGQHVENAETKRRFRNLLEVSGLLRQLDTLESEPATADDLALVHDPAYIARVRAMSMAAGGDAGCHAPFGPGSYEIARLSAGGTSAVVDAVLTGRVRNGYALVRPPGHHAERDRGYGFCLFANVPIAVVKARRDHGLERIAIIDWDVHHGNGTQQTFYGDRDTLTISVHQDGLFPRETGGLSERGIGQGIGSNINIPLPAGCGHGAYAAVFDRIVVPALRRFRPELIVVCCGFDASAVDPLGRMMLHSDSYRMLTRLLMEVADDLCGGRLAMSHEGGYSASYVPYCGLAVMEQLSGIRSLIQDPFLSTFADYPGQQLTAFQEAAIGSIVEALAP